MSTDRGVFFIPGVDLGVVYGPGVGELRGGWIDKLKVSGRWVWSHC